MESLVILVFLAFLGIPLGIFSSALLAYHATALWAGAAHLLDRVGHAARVAYLKRTRVPNYPTYDAETPEWTREGLSAPALAYLDGDTSLAEATRRARLDAGHYSSDLQR